MSRPPHPTTQRLEEQFSAEADYSDSGSDDFEALSRDRTLVRSMRAADLAAIVAIDRRVTGHDREAYYRRKVDEALGESGIRVSLVAEADERVAGFVMARVDYGEFGQTQTAAILDTIGVDPALGGDGVGTALVSQLLANLASLQVETVRSELAWENFGLCRFLHQCGFRPSQMLALTREL